jgi:hypothetical protein
VKISFVLVNIALTSCLSSGNNELRDTIPSAFQFCVHEDRMFSYLFVLAAIFSRILPHPWFSFTAVGASLLVFGARRSPKLFILPVLALAVADYYLTVFAYNYAFHVQDYAVTWVWYLGACWMGYAFLRKKANAGRVVGAALASSTSFFLASNCAVWASSLLYPHTAGGLATCYIAGLPFYRNDVLATTLLTGAVFAVPVLARRMADAWERHSLNSPSGPTAA